jgi:nitrogen fixation NifU-like protein
MEQCGIDFWQNHSLRFLEMVFQTDKRETLRNPDGYGRSSRSECGDMIEIFLTMRNGRIASASFETNGCIYTLASANAIVHIAEGKSLEEAWEIGPEDVMDYLETLPRAEKHCAQLAVRTLQNALINARENRRHPWKKLYQSQ